MASKGIEAFLDFLREANTQLNIAVMVEQEANDKTQDILHRLELQDHAYHEYAALSKELKAIRKERRNAKDEIACLSPIVESYILRGKKQSCGGFYLMNIAILRLKSSATSMTTRNYWRWSDGGCKNHNRRMGC